jgi:hypothetical protein
MKLKSLLFFFPFTLFGTTQNGDFQIWLADQIRQPLIKNTLFLAEIHHRFDHQASNFFYWHLQEQLAYNIKWLEVALGYRQTYINLSPPDWNSTYGLIFDLTLFKKIREFNCSSRFRLQHMSDRGIKTFIYRERLWMDTPITKGINFCLEEEFFFTERVGFSQNRISVCLIFTPNKTVTIRPFYRLRHQKITETSWRFQNILGVNTLFNF